MMQPGGDLARLLCEAAEALTSPSPGQAVLLGRLNELGSRLRDERFRLAVLGQFKRGKSTLLNALVGEALLPTAVTPVTAIPTFVDHGAAPTLTLTYQDARRESRKIGDVPELARRVAALVAEEANPHNVLGIERVEVVLPYSSLPGVTLIDTPGIGSTHRHNTETARAVLPECDAALFVVSADPPITEAESDYLAQISDTVAHLVIVLNKVDLLSDNDRDTATAFLRRVLQDRPEVVRRAHIFPISARAALNAKLSEDHALLEESGLLKLEGFLSDFLAREKRSILQAAIVLKAKTIVADLRTETEIRLRSLLLPLHELDSKIVRFAETAAIFEKERLRIRDALSGDRSRALAALDAECGGIAEKARELHPRVGEQIADALTAEDARTRVEPLVEAFFDRELSEVVERMTARINENAAAHRLRLDALVKLVRQTAADLMDVKPPQATSDEEFQPTREPYWVASGTRDSLGSLAASAMSRFLPRAMRRRRLREAVLRGVDTAVTRNVASLHWAMRQNVEETFRRLETALSRRLEAALAATRDVMILARARRSNGGAAAADELAAVQRSLDDLLRIEGSLGNCTRAAVWSFAGPAGQPNSTYS